MAGKSKTPGTHKNYINVNQRSHIKTPSLVQKGLRYRTSGFNVKKHSKNKPGKYHFAQN